MRLWFSGPRILGVRTGISLGPDDFRRISAPTGAVSSRAAPALVYVIKGPHDYVKVGVSADPAARMATLQTGSPVALTLAYVAAVKSGNATQIEQVAHATLSRHRQAGEWFDVSVEMAVAAISAASIRVSDPIVSIAPEMLAYALARAANETDQPSKATSASTGLRWVWGLSLVFPIIIVWACVAGVQDHPEEGTGGFIGVGFFLTALWFTVMYVITRFLRWAMTPSVRHHLPT